MSATMELSLTGTLKKFFGFSKFNGNQEKIILLSATGYSK